MEWLIILSVKMLRILPKFLRRFKLVWKSLLHGRFKVQATNGYCVPLLSYGFGIVEWTKSEICHFDVLTRKIMMSPNSHHPHSATECLYLPRYMRISEYRTFISTTTSNDVSSSSNIMRSFGEGVL